MKLKLLMSLVLLLAVSAEANQKFKINLDKQNISVSSLEKNNNTFNKFSLKGYENDKIVGAPELPVRSWLVVGKPDQIKADLKISASEVFAGTPAPVQEQDCRCATDKIKKFEYDQTLYTKPLQNVSVNYLGAFRGRHLSQVSLRLGTYDQSKNLVHLITEAELDINSSEFVFPRGDYKDYLILGAANLMSGVNDFANWKRSRGYNVTVESINSPNNTTAAIQAIIKQAYTEKGIDFVIIVGDETAIPQFRVSTSGSSQTPSDLKYYTLDGAADFIPEMLTSRIVADTAEQVAAQLAKSIEFEQRSHANLNGANKFIGIASNEGSNPSDDQYVKAIEAKYVEVLSSEIVHLYQNDSVNSKPSVLNSHFDSGAAWLTYLGHGSGTSWPSFNQSYSTTNIKQINNKPTFKPIIIDVACQNGRLVKNYLGTDFMKVQSQASNEAFGAVAYYGGSVNISWHPPAVMAQGIAFEHLAKKFNHLGEALLAGQLYLAGKWTNKNEVIDNFEWYHLQGDPGLSIAF